MITKMKRLSHLILFIALLVATVVASTTEEGEQCNSLPSAETCLSSNSSSLCYWCQDSDKQFCGHALQIIQLESLGVHPVCKGAFPDDAEPTANSTGGMLGEIAINTAKRFAVELCVNTMRQRDSYLDVCVPAIPQSIMDDFVYFANNYACMLGCTKRGLTALSRASANLATTLQQCAIFGYFTPKLKTFSEKIGQAVSWVSNPEQIPAFRILYDAAMAIQKNDWRGVAATKLAEAINNVVQPRF